jgi:hypothetical protein
MTKENLIEKIFSSWDKHYYNSEWILMKAVLIWWVVINYFENWTKQVINIQMRINRVNRLIYELEDDIDTFWMNKEDKVKLDSYKKELEELKSIL